MRMRSDVESHVAAGVRPDPEVPRVRDRLDRPQLAVGYTEIVGRRGELHAITDRERALDLAVHRHTGQASRIVRLRLAVLTRNRDAIVCRIDVRDARALARRYAEDFAAARKAHHVVDAVLPRPAPVGAGHVLSG